MTPCSLIVTINGVVMSSDLVAAASIRRDAVYALADFLAITRLSDAAMRSARRSGLKVRRLGRRSFVLGEEFATFIAGCCPVVDGRGALVSHAVGPFVQRKQNAITDGVEP
jgi:hypothetical protein